MEEEILSEEEIETPTKKDKNIHSQEKNKISEEERMHEIKEWEADYAEMQAEWYADNM